MANPPTINLQLTFHEAEQLLALLAHKDKTTTLRHPHPLSSVRNSLDRLILEAGSASYGPPVMRYLILDPDDVSTRYHTGDGDWSQRRDRAHRYATIEAACADIRGCDAEQLFDLQVVVDVDAYAVIK